METQLQRIRDMEALLDRLPSMDPETAREALRTLKDYYTGPLWRQDYAADEAGLLPRDLKRGVLAQDTLHDLLTEASTERSSAMTARELQEKGHLYRLDQDLKDQHRNAQRLTRLLEATPETEPQKRRDIIRELFAEAPEDVCVKPPFFCDYGCNTRVGKHFYAGYDCAFLDCGRITIGDHVMLGPKVALYAVNHPMDPTVRDTGLEYGVPITIGSHVWIGGSTTVCPGVTIGDNVVIGAGSVVVRDIPDNCLAVGNPARVVRYFGEEDKRYWEEELRLYRELADDPIV